MCDESTSVLIAAGETSGETHAAGLVEAVRLMRPEPPIHWFGCGGEQMRRGGVELLADVTQLAAIGPWDAALQMGAYWRLYRRLVDEASKRNVRLAILVDFPDFNLRLARRLKELGLSVCYFIGPQVWAWRSSRVEEIRRYVDLMLVILPFEEEFYRRLGVQACYVGNPSVTRLRNSRQSSEHAHVSSLDRSCVPLVALLPGSRNREVERILPIQLAAAQYVNERVRSRFRIAGAPAVDRALLENLCRGWRATTSRDVDLDISGQVAERLLTQADCAIIKSGTSTLEAMILGIPFAMVYRLPWASYLLARPFTSTRTYCLANLVAGRQVAPEFVQHRAKANAIGDHIIWLLSEPERRRRVREELLQASGVLGERDAYQEAAKCIYSLLPRSAGT